MRTEGESRGGPGSGMYRYRYVNWQESRSWSHSKKLNLEDYCAAGHDCHGFHGSPPASLRPFFQSHQSVIRHRAQSAGQIARLAPRRLFQIGNRLGFAVVDDPQ